MTLKSSLLIAAACVALTATSAPKKAAKDSGNPFLSEYKTKYQIPPFEKIRLEHYKPALEEGMRQHDAEIAAIIANSATPDFDNTVLALDNSGEVFNKVCYVFYALSESDATPEMQALAEQLSPAITAHNDEMYMNDLLFQRIKSVHDNADKLGLTPVQKRLTDKYYLRFVRNGALLNPEQKAELKEINRREAELELSFANNMMHEISHNIIYITDAKRLSGLSQSTIDDAAALAQSKGHEGWAFTATGATRLAVLTSADDRELRRDMYLTYTNTASRGDEYDNSANINEIMKLRQRKAKLLGFDTFADYATAPVMA